MQFRITRHNNTMYLRQGATTRVLFSLMTGLVYVTLTEVSSTKSEIVKQAIEKTLKSKETDTSKTRFCCLVEQRNRRVKQENYI